MRIPFLFLAALLTAFALVVSPGARAQPAPTSPDTAAILQAARTDVAGQLGGKPVLLDVRDQNIFGDWVFLWAKMQEPGGAPIDYRGTPFAAAAANGTKSKSYAGLFRKSGDGQWQRVDSVVGPTDVAWEGWAARYGAPAGIFVTS